MGDLPNVCYLGIFAQSVSHFVWQWDLQGERLGGLVLGPLMEASLQ